MKSASFSRGVATHVCVSMLKWVCPSVKLQATFTHVADGSSREVRPLWCASCDVALTLTHLTQCADAAVFRSSQLIAVQTVLSSEDCTHPWLHANRHRTLTELLVQLFPRPLDTPMHLHTTRVMCGVFSTRQTNAAIKALNCKRADEGVKLMQKLRLCCLDGVHTFFQALKTALP